MVVMVQLRSFLFVIQIFVVSWKRTASVNVILQECRGRRKTENRLFEAVKLVPTSKKTTPSWVPWKCSITYCRIKQTHKGIWSAKFWVDKWLNMNLNGERSQCDDMPIKSHKFFRHYLNSFTCKTTFRLHAWQRCRRSCCRSKEMTCTCHSEF
jgi:hypothetical protein